MILVVKLAYSVDSNTSQASHVSDVSTPCHEDVYEGISSPCDSFRALHVRSSKLVNCSDVATITDLCQAHGDNGLPEVDLVSLIEEKLPRYTLRADTLTDFGGYSNVDWTVETPCLAPDIDLDLSTEFVKQTLDYFVMSGERLMHMTRTYYDIGSLTLLLEEKEKDLELAARIGQRLLTDKCSLQKKNDSLEEQLLQANDKVAQLKHSISVKDALLQIYVNSDKEDVASPSVHPAIATTSSSATIDILQRKIRVLDTENANLKASMEHFSKTADDLDDREAGLVNDCVRELSEASKRMSHVHDELAAKSELVVAQQRKIEQLMDKIAMLEKHIVELNIDNSELNKQSAALKKTQQELVAEVADLEDKYNECLALLHEAQEEIRELQKMKKPDVIRYHYNNQSPYLSGNSLAVQLEESLRKNLGNKQLKNGNHVMRAMNTVRTANNSKESCDEGSTFLPLLTCSGYDAVRRPLKMACLSPSVNENGLLHTMTEDKSPECHSPDSYLSTGSGSENDLQNLRFRRPKLQIIKQMEGSETLHKWRSLAIPHLASVLESRPGVQIRGQHVDSCVEEEEYSISDIEEDDDFRTNNLAKDIDMTSLTYTFTVSKITQPSTCYVTATTVSGLWNSSYQQLYVSCPQTDNCFTSANAVTASNEESISQQHTLFGSGRLSDLLRRLGFTAAVETSSSPDSVGFSDKSGEHIESSSRSIVDKVVVVSSSTKEQRTESTRRGFVGPSHTTTAVGLNSVTAIKRRAGPRIVANSSNPIASAWDACDSGGVHRRDQLLSRQPVKDVTHVQIGSSSITCSPLESGLKTMDHNSASQEVFSNASNDWLHAGEKNLALESGFPSRMNLVSASYSCQEMQSGKDTLLIRVMSEPDALPRTTDSSSLSMPAFVTDQKGVLSMFSANPSAAPRRPSSLDVTSSYPISSRSSCVLTSSLSTVVHSRVSISLAVSASSES